MGPGGDRDGRLRCIGRRFAVGWGARRRSGINDVALSKEAGGRRVRRSWRPVKRQPLLQADVADRLPW